MFLYFLIYYTISFGFEVFSCLIWPFIIELISTFTYPGADTTKEIISLALLFLYLIFVFLVCAINLGYIIYFFAELDKYKKKVKRPKEVEEEGSSSGEEEEVEEGVKGKKWFHRFPVKIKMLTIIMIFLIFGFFFHLITFFIVYTDWTYYSNCNEEFPIDLYCLFTRDAFVGPFGPSNTTSIQPILAGAVVVWVFHLISIIIIFISFILLVFAIIWLVVMFLRYYPRIIKRKIRKKMRKLERRKKKIEEKKENFESQKQNVGRFDCQVEFNTPMQLPDVPVATMDEVKPPENLVLPPTEQLLEENKSEVVPPINTEPVMEQQNRQPVINPEVQQVVREKAIIPNTK